MSVATLFQLAGWLVVVVNVVAAFFWRGESERLGEGGQKSENSFSLRHQPLFCFSVTIFCAAPGLAERIEHPRVNVVMSLVFFFLGKWTWDIHIHNTRITEHETRKT